MPKWVQEGLPEEAEEGWPEKQEGHQDTVVSLQLEGVLLPFSTTIFLITHTSHSSWC